MGIQVVILAGGLATRLGDLTRNQPKSMLEVAGKPFLEHQLNLLKRGGVTDIVLCLGHFGDQIQNYFGGGEKFGVKIRYSFEENLMGTAGALKQARHLLADNFLTLYGDSYLLVDYHAVWSRLVSRKKLGLMTICENHDRWDKSNVAMEGELVKRYSKTARTPDMVYVDYGLNAFRKEVLDLVPEKQPYPMEELFPRLIERQELVAYMVSQRFYEIGSQTGLNELKEFIKV